ncbi:MAG: cytochrome b/b6 domain-containing protein [Pyrobaculum sp.]
MDKIEIISIGYKIVHHWNLLLFTVLAITGGVLFSIEVTSWFAYIIGSPLSTVLGTDPVTAGVQLLRTSHRFIGFIWGALLITYGIYLLAFRRVEIFKPLARPLSKQMAEAKALIRHYLTGRPLPPDVEKELERHNVLVSYMAILLIVSIIFLSASGVLLVYKDALGISAATASWLVLLHDIGFALGLLFVAFHLFAVTHPSNRPLLVAMFGDGKAELSWVQKHMPKYLARRGLR